MEQQEKRKHRRRYQSLFWSMILVGVGTAWFLFNIGIFTGENIAVALQLWPLLLVVIGLDIIFGRRSPSRGATIGLAFVGLMMAIMYIGPSIGLGVSAERKNTQYDVPLDGAEALSLNIKAGMDSVTINPLVDSNNLIEADLWHYGELELDLDVYEVSKSVSIQEQDGLFNFGLDLGAGEDSGWSINLNPSAQLALDFEGGVGQIEMDLESFNLTDVKLNMGIGSLIVKLPVPQQSYTVDIAGGIGEATVDIPDDTAIQVIVSTGIGDAQLPSYLIQVDGEDGFLGEDGTWQSEGFDQAENTITLMFDGGIGSLKVD